MPGMLLWLLYIIAIFAIFWMHPERWHILVERNLHDSMIVVMFMRNSSDFCVWLSLITFFAILRKCMSHLLVGFIGRIACVFSYMPFIIIIGDILSVVAYTYREYFMMSDECYEALGVSITSYYKCVQLQQKMHDAYAQHARSVPMAYQSTRFGQPNIVESLLEPFAQIFQWMKDSERMSKKAYSLHIERRDALRCENDDLSIPGPCWSIPIIMYE